MGIDLYLHWQDQTEPERQAQFTGFATAATAGYIREAYHGEPYATQVLIPEAFEDGTWGSDDGMDGALIAVTTDAPPLFDGQPVVSIDTLRGRVADAQAAARERGRTVYAARPEYGEEHAAAIEAFVELAERLVGDGRTVTAYASY